MQIQYVEGAGEQTRAFKHLGFITASIVATLLISNIAATKAVQIGPITTDGGNLLFPLSYIFGDILTEVYGYKASRRVIYTGFLWLFIAALMLQLVVAAPPAAEYTLQSSFAAVLGQTPRIVVASLLGYFSGEFVNSYVLARMKVWTNGRVLWSRTIGSTIFGQAVDTIMFVLVAFAGVFSWATIFAMITTGYLMKVAIEVILTPVTYQIIRWLKRQEGVDVYDRGTNFNPFALRELFN